MAHSRPIRDVGIDVLCLEEDSARKLDTIPTDQVNRSSTILTVSAYLD